MSADGCCTRPRQGAAWRAAGMIGVASTSRDASSRRDDFVADVQHALSDSGLVPGALTLELTETALMRDADADVRRLAIKELGVRIAIDDFGAGYSSLGYLQQLPGRRAEDRPLVHRAA